MLLRMFKMDRIVDAIKYWSQRRYSAHYDPRYKIADAYHAHAAVDAKLRRFIEDLKIDIFSHGMKNPLLVTIKDGKATIHPGKCRAAALKGLGRSYAPALVVNFDDPKGDREIAPQCVPITSKEQAQSYFSEDCLVEMSHRGLTVKKKRET